MIARPLGLALAVIFVAACDGQPTTDAGVDGGSDGGRDSGPPDGGAVCEPLCAVREACCAEPGVGGVCANLAEDVEHCGMCTIDCVASGRGTSCRSSTCACGDFDLGCIGRMSSFCCVPPEGMGAPHCANLQQDTADCGECGRACDPMVGNDCQGARCVCGDSRTGCGGALTDRCCGDRFEVYACVDSTSDREHCGACGNRCVSGMRCVASTCVP